MHTSKALVPEHSPFKVESAMGKLKRYKSPGTDYIMAEMIKAGGNTLHFKFHELINCIWNK
jgi:hypothetical protein